jgi:hypothetical protein
MISKAFGSRDYAAPQPQSLFYKPALSQQSQVNVQTYQYPQYATLNKTSTSTSLNTNIFPNPYPTLKSYRGLEQY